MNGVKRSGFIPAEWTDSFALTSVTIVDGYPVIVACVDGRTSFHRKTSFNSESYSLAWVSSYDPGTVSEVSIRSGETRSGDGTVRCDQIATA